MTPSTIHAVDLFCGAGGTSTGLARACKRLGLDVDLLAINHWTTAVNTHSLNHPWARHLCVPVESVNPREAMPGGRVDILCASPECTHHSTARGGKPVSDQLRASAWHIMRWVNELDVRNILIENVPEFESWGPVSKKTGRPIKREKGRYFRAFIDALTSCGYTVQYKVLNAADYGDPTSRKRMYIVARKGKRAPAWPKPTHSKGGLDPGTQRWRAAREVIDWSIEGKSIFERERPLSDKTVERILKGLERHGGPALKPFLVVLRGGDAARSGRSIEEPAPTLTAGGEHVGVAEPFLLGQQSGGAPRPVSEPAPTVAAGGAIGLAQPVVVDTIGSKDTWPARARSIEDPLPTVMGDAGRWGVARPVLVPYNGNSTPASVDAPVPTQPTHDRFGLAEPFLITTDRLDTNRSLPRPVSEPCPTVVANNQRIGLAEAFLIPNFGEREGQEPRTHSLDEPAPAVTSHGAGALVQPILLPPDGPGGNGEYNHAKPVDEPLPTIRASRGDRIALVQPVIDGKKLDIRFRMLQPHELAAAMGFGADYKFVGNRRDVIKQIGNAVAVNQAMNLVLALLDSRGAAQTNLDQVTDEVGEVAA